MQGKEPSEKRYGSWKTLNCFRIYFFHRQTRNEMWTTVAVLPAGGWNWHKVGRQFLGERARIDKIWHKQPSDPPGLWVSNEKIVHCLRQFGSSIYCYFQLEGHTIGKVTLLDSYNVLKKCLSNLRIYNTATETYKSIQ